MFSPETIDDGFVVETERLLLRWPRLSDGPAIERLAGERAVAEMTALIPHPYPAGAADAFVLAARLANAAGTGLTLAISPRRKPREVMGAIALHSPRAGSDQGGAGLSQEPFIGYWLGHEFWGKGLATEAARAMVDLAFEQADARVVTAEVRAINVASRRVLDKLGFRELGTALSLFPARGGLFPVSRMRLSRHAWLMARQPAAVADPAPAEAARAEIVC